MFRNINRSCKFARTDYEMLPTQCPICGPNSFVYKDKQMLNSHMYKKHPADEARNQCQICGPDSRVYASVDYLREHMRTKHETKDKMVCPTCEHSFETKRNLTRHLQRQVCSQPNSRYQRSLATTITATGGAIRQQPEGAPDEAASETNLVGCGQGDADFGYSENAHMSDEMYQTYIQSNSQPCTTGSGTSGMDEGSQAGGSMISFEEYQAQLQIYQQQNANTALQCQADPNVLNSSSHSQNFDTLGRGPLAQAASFPDGIDQASSYTPGDFHNPLDHYPLEQVGVSSTLDIGLDFDPLEHWDLGQTQLPRSSMTTEEYQGYLQSIGLY